MPAAPSITGRPPRGDFEPWDAYQRRTGAPTPPSQPRGTPPRRTPGWNPPGGTTPAPVPRTPGHRRGPQPPGGGGTTPAPGGDGDPLDYFTSLTRDLPPNSASLISLEPQLNARGITVMRNASGIAGKIKLPSGEIVDVGQNFGSSNPNSMRWQTLRSDKRYRNGVLIGTPPPVARPPGEQAVPRGTFGEPPYPAAYAAAQRTRQQAGVGGRGATILGGFAPGTPRTRPRTLLGRP